MKRYGKSWGIILLGVVCVSLVAWADHHEVGYAPIFNGKDLTGIKLVGINEGTFKIQDGVLMCSGNPQGYWHTEKSYKNYVLRFDWRFPKGGNSGYLIHITGDHKVWPKCIEVQGHINDAGNIFGIAGGKITGKKDAAAQKAAIKPAGEWNEMEVTSLNGTLISRINGQVVSWGTGSDVTSGSIGFQSEGAEIHWRNLRIKELAE